MASEEILISVKDISKRFEIYDKPMHRLYQMLCCGKKQFFNEFWALRDINFEVRRGECIGIIGRNGAGKSTLLQILTGTLSPTTGSVTCKGRVAALLELGSGFNPDFTGRENVFLNASILGLTESEIHARFQDIVDFSEIGDFIDQPVKSYSSGMLMRLAFSVIAHVDADVLIVDEALAVGDAFFVQKCMRFMRKFMEDHTVLFVSHDTGAVVNLCDRAILLNCGRIKMQGDPKAVSEEYLKEMYAKSQNMGGVAVAQTSQTDEDLFYRDMRADIINQSTIRNDLEVFRFNAADTFGTGSGLVRNVYFTDMGNRPLAWIVGGEMVRLRAECQAISELQSPILGFILKDHLGQMLLGDNTYLSYMESPQRMNPGETFAVEFVFRMPYLAVGDYSITIGLADGTNEKHVQCQWVNDAIVFKSHSQSPASHLVGIPMKEIKIVRGDAS